MAKRIKVTGKTPRGLNLNKVPRGRSKADRIMDNAEAANYRTTGNPGIFGGQLDRRELIESMGLGRGATIPSSTRKKLVKEGSRKFVGPLQEKEFDPWEEFEGHEGSWTPRSSHEARRGYTKKFRRADDADDRRRDKSARIGGHFLDRLPSRGYRRPFTEKLSKREVELLKKEILEEAGSKEGRLLHKMLIRNPRIRERWAERRQRNLGGGQEFDPPF